MMQALRRKLNSQSGASIMMALLLLLVAVMVSAVIISSALSSAMSVRSDRLQQQAYLTVSSAAELLRDDLANCGYTHVVTKSYSSSTNRENDKNGTTTADTTTNGGGVFATILSDMMTWAESAGSYTETYTVSVPGYDDVTANFALKKNTDGTFTLTVWFVGGTSPNECRMCLTAAASVKTSTSDTTSGWFLNIKYLRTTTTELTWGKGELQRKAVS